MSSEENKKIEKSDVAKREEDVLKFWQDNHIFEKSLEKPSDKGEFVFYEGPPTANAKPALHHLEARAFKDILPRYKTMQGFHVRRKGGWDTHGLPVELQIEKKLGFTSKKDIEEYGIEAFNKVCKESVFEYIGDWEKFTDRIGYWVDKKSAYYTFDATYMESVWNILKIVDDKKFLYKDFKVLPWCPRDETALSSHELAQGYQEDKDLSVTVKFKVTNPEKIGLSGDVFLLAWTTTPWTLPGNVALAVGEDIEYVKVRKFSSANISTDKTDAHNVDSNNALYIVAKSIHKNSAGQAFAIVPEGELKGSDMVGLHYEPLFPYLQEKFGNKNPESFAKAYQVYIADFVNTDEGTGIVHTAVMYGQDDFVLGTQIGLPKFHLVNEQGRFIDGMGNLSGRFVKEMDENGKPTVATDIIDYLTDKGFYFNKENIKHQYPHCWRCKTPLIYYARDSWYIRMSSLRDTLVKENESINWEPSHVREGRFGEWIREVKDWAISRERYWGTPLPIWTDVEGNYRVIGSIDEMKKLTPKSGNNYFVMRHGEASTNPKDEVNEDEKRIVHLTEKGKEQVSSAAEELKEKKIDMIICSPFDRCKETAHITAKEIGFDGEVIFDERLGEINTGPEWEGKTWDEYVNSFADTKERFVKAPVGGETLSDVNRRVGQVLFELEEKYKGKNILLISHHGTIVGFQTVARAADMATAIVIKDAPASGKYKLAEISKLDFWLFPHDENYFLDLHKPFIDEVKLVDEQGRELTRVKEVMDVWFDSGAMPFAQDHYPFENKEYIDTVGFPADFISEAIDQTRGWFYTLHAIGILMGKGRAYKNVICLGHILDAEGKKMSKSVGNIVDPWMVIDTYGVDALRLWMYSVNQPGDSKNFDVKTVDEIVKKVFNPLNNIVAFYELYADKNLESRTSNLEPTHILDKWIVSRLNELIEQGTEALEEYHVFEASRAIRDFVNDFSTWYIRRSRERFKSENQDDKNNALETTRFVLLELMKYMAPFTPFFAEEIYQKFHSSADPISVHLCNFPKGGGVDTTLLNDMEKVRETVTTVLEARSKAGIKVRQPLAALVIKEKLSMELRTILAEEVNVKEVVSDESLEPPFELDTTITPELQTEGNVRDFIRAVQDARKVAKLAPMQTIILSVQTDEVGKTFLEQNHLAIKKPTNVGSFEFEKNGGEEFVIENMKFKIEIK